MILASTPNSDLQAATHGSAHLGHRVGDADRPRRTACVPLRCICTEEECQLLTHLGRDPDSRLGAICRRRDEAVEASGQGRPQVRSVLGSDHVADLDLVETLPVDSFRGPDEEAVVVRAGNSVTRAQDRFAYLAQPAVVEGIRLLNAVKRCDLSDVRTKLSAGSPLCRLSMRTSPSLVASSVSPVTHLEIAPEMNGCAAAIIRTWPM